MSHKVLLRSDSAPQKSGKKSASVNPGTIESQMELNAVSLSQSAHTIRHKMHVSPIVTSWGSLPKSSSASNVAKNSPHMADPVVPASPIPHHGQRPSLAGFDPFLTNGCSQSSPSGQTMTAVKVQGPNIPTQQKYAPRGPKSQQSPHVSSDSARKAAKENVRALNISKSSSPLGAPPPPPPSAATPTANDTPVEKRSQSTSRDPSPVCQENDRRQPPTPSRSPGAKATSKSDSKQREPSTPRIFSPLTPSNQRNRRASQPSSGGGKLLPFLRKGHRRSKSLESEKKNEIPEAITSQTSEPNPQCMSAESEDSKTTSNGIVQELMDLKDKFIQLQIPTLAKPSPTSFLTGKGDEAVRTSEYEPSPFQVEIPSLPEVVEMARLNDFVENYRRMDQNFDLRELIGYSRTDLQQVKIKEHIPIAQSLLECGDGLVVQGFLSKGTYADDRLEAVVFEGQRYFIVIFRGTTEQQTKVLGSSKSKRRAVPLDPQQENVEVYSGFKEEYSKLEQECFALVDRLSEQNPFCDVVFSGYSFGAAMATLAASRYATARPMMRVGCFTLASPKVGFSLFRHVVNSLPNLKVIRLELGQDSKCQAPTVGGWHVGHTIVLSSSLSQQNTQKTNKPILAYKFDTPKHKKFKTTHPDLRNYITTLEEVARLNIPWVKDFVNTAGKGVVVNNEARQVV